VSQKDSWRNIFWFTVRAVSLYGKLVTIYTICFRIQTFCTLSTQYVYVFAVIITMNNDHGPIRDEACSL